MKTVIRGVAVAALALASVHGFADQGTWLVRARATQLSWDNAQTGAANTLNVNAKDQLIPEVDISYFITKNIATELVLTYPQEVEIRAGSSSLGKVKALPPSILVQYHFTDFGVIRPYVGAGVNYTIFSSRKGLGGGTYALESSSLGYVAQVGADYMLDKQWGLNVDVKYIRMSTDVITNSDGAHVGELKLNPIAAALGVVYKF